MTRELEKMGFLVESLEYYKYLSHNMQTALRTNSGITTQYVRTRADRIATHKETGITFELEFKTHYSSKSSNMMITALPLAIHLWNSQLGIKCLYIYEDPISNIVKGFWADNENRPKIKRLRFPQHDGLPRDEMYSIFDRVFPEIKLYSDGLGARQPYLVIDYKEEEKLPQWQSLVSALI